VYAASDFVATVAKYPCLIGLNHAVVASEKHRRKYCQIGRSLHITVPDNLPTVIGIFALCDYRQILLRLANSPSFVGLMFVPRVFREMVYDFAISCQVSPPGSLARHRDDFHLISF
jgi:hypothetical protein